MDAIGRERLKELAEHPALTAILAKMEANVIAALKKAQDPAERERLWQKWQMVPEFQRELRAEIDRSFRQA